ncbi:MAG: ATP synthase F1 subunit gamma [Clostridiales bacterium]|jgi:F-type H+-transporting ATPase subunit gamma|nr:ATP synthase F1 subunit gamma [Clostridiales bacterium]
MLNIADIKNRIKSIGDTAKITKAMQLVSVAKMNKELVKYESNQAYFKKVKYTVASILKQSALKHRYINSRGGDRTAFIVIASDKGMAGDFNSRVLNLAYSHIEKLKETYIFTIGMMARDFFLSKGLTIDIEFLHTTQNPTMSDAAKITYDILELYDKDLFDKIYVVYTEKTSVVKQFPAIMQLLPVSLETLLPKGADGGGELFRGVFRFEPDERSALDVIITEYLTGVLYSTLIQSVAAEHFKRMTTMRQATENARKMVEELKIKYHRARQENITTAILEINNGIKLNETH